MSRDAQGGEHGATQGEGRSQSCGNSAFRQHLERASEIVQNWPPWKQEILGRAPSQPAGRPSSGDQQQP